MVASNHMEIEMNMQINDKVWYLGEFKATVVGVKTNGVIIEFWGQGFQRDQLIRKRVAARYLTARA